MLQAEIAGRLFPSHEGYPARGDVIRDFELISSQGHPVLLSEYRGRRNLVLVLAGNSDSANSLLSELVQYQPQLAGNEARALAVVPGTRERAYQLKHALHLNFVLLADEDRRVHLSMGTADQAGHVLPAVFVTDRFGEVFAAFKTAQGMALPAVAEIVGWLEFINQLCPECGPSEWPD